MVDVRCGGNLPAIKQPVDRYTQTVESFFRQYREEWRFTQWAAIIDECKINRDVVTTRERH